MEPLPNDQTVRDPKRKRKRMRKKMAEKTFWIVLIFTIIPAVVDMSLDTVNGVHMINGQYYTKVLPNVTGENEECILLETILVYGSSTYSFILNNSMSQSRTLWKISCYEKDPYWGYATLFLLFFPSGLMFPDQGDLMELLSGRTLTEATNMQHFIIGILKIFLIPFAPFILLITFMSGLFIHTPKMKRWLLAASQSEGTWEASLQICLQLYIIFNKKERSPSYIQIASLIVTIITLNKSSIEIFLSKAKKNGVNTQDEEDFLEGISLGDTLRAILQYLPLFLLVTWFRVGSITILAVLLKKYAAYFYGCLFVLMYLITTVGYTCYAKKRFPHLGSNALTKTMYAFRFACFANTIIMTRNIELTRKDNKHFLLFHLLLHLTFNTVAVTTLMVAVATGNNFHHWEDLALLQDPVLFYSIIFSVLGCGLMSVPVFIWQIWKAEEDYAISSVSENENLTMGSIHGDVPKDAKFEIGSAAGDIF